MSKIPSRVTFFLLVTGIVSGLYILSSTDLDLSHADIVRGEIGIFACVGALISATWLVAGFYQANQAFIESQRPQLLIRIGNREVRESDKMIPVTEILYRNITSNQFNDLNIRVKIEVDNQYVDLSHLFSPNMVMIGMDERRRNVLILKETQDKGIDLNDLTRAGHEAVLNISYDYTYLESAKKVAIQTYRWEPNREEWDVI